VGRRCPVLPDRDDSKERDGSWRADCSADRVDCSPLARLRGRAESLGLAEPARYVFAPFVPKFTFTGKKVIGYNVTGFDSTTHVNSWRTAWRTLTKKAGLPGFRFHDLRIARSRRSLRAARQTPPSSRLAGHVSRRMLERYSHVRMEAKRTAMETLATSTRMAGYETNPCL
jgi:integrase